MKTIKLYIIPLILLSFSCKQNSTDQISNIYNEGLEIVPSEHSGIDFNNTLSDDPLSDKNVLSYEYYFHGAGVGVADFNQDGLQDIFLAGNEVPNELYINQGDFKFTKLGEEAGINKNKVWSAGVTIVDINNDSYPDIYVCQQGPYTPDQRRNLFYINNGDLTFTESARVMGLDDPNISTHSVFLDFDKDGDLDCYVMNESKYVRVVLAEIYKDLEKKENMVAASGKLFENIGGLKFKDITEKAGVLNYGYGLGLAVSDFNGDNWPDIYVVNDYTVPDFMYINQKDGTFKESVKEYTRQISYFGMGCDVADINNDGLVDIGVVDMAAEDHFRDKTLMAGMDSEGFNYYFYELGYQFQYMFNSLQLNHGNGFSNIAALAGVHKSDWSWAALFSDLNLDGFKDYYVSNGYRRYLRDNDFQITLAQIKKENRGNVPNSMREELYAMMPEIKLKNKMYINNGDLYFDDHNPTFSHPDLDTYSYGTAISDLDNDGDPDIIISNIDQPITLLRNNCNDDGSKNYIKIRLEHPNYAKKLNSKVYVHCEDQIIMQEYTFARGYESTMEETLLFGLGQNEVDSIKVIWPDNNILVLKDVESNQLLKIEYEKGYPFKKESFKGEMVTPLKNQELQVDFVHQENPFDDFEREILLPQKQTAFGPALATADVNNDGLEDFFIGGAKGQAGCLYLQNPDGTFIKAQSQPWTIDTQSEDISAVFVDPNQDGNLDLMVFSGGSSDFVNEKTLLADRFYANMGGGQFGKIGNVLEPYNEAVYNVIAENIDGDPQLELLIIGAAKPGLYPHREPTRLLDYSNNKYVDISNGLLDELNDAEGLIRDAVWIDLNNDKIKDLITVGEWQSVEVYLNKNGKLERQTDDFGITAKEGWWRSISKSDLDGDGDYDFIVGNVGVNFKKKANSDHPLYMYSNDFDNNGTQDIVLAKDYKDKIVPTRGRQCSSEQMPFIEEKYETYKAFANADVIDILGSKNIKEGIQLQAVDFHSYIVWNENGRFEFQKLPMLAQAFPINDILIQDLNDDGQQDIILIGNDYNTEYETPRLDAGSGLILIQESEKKFKPLNPTQSGLYSPGDTKKIRTVSSSNGQYIIIANNNSKPDLYKLNI